MSRITSRFTKYSWIHCHRRLLVAGAVLIVLLVTARVGSMSQTTLRYTALLAGMALALYALAILISKAHAAAIAVLCVAVGVLVDWYSILPLPTGIPQPYWAPLIALAFISYCFITQLQQGAWIAPPYLRLWILFMLLAVPAIPLGIPLFGSLAYYVAIIVTPLVMFELGALVATDPAQVQKLLSYVAGFGSLVALHTIIQARTGVFLLQTGTMRDILDAASDFTLTSANGVQAARAASFLMNPDADGMFLAAVALLPIGLLASTRSALARVVYAMEAMLCLLALLFTYSVAAILATAVGLLALLVLVDANRFRLGLVACICAAVGVISMALPSDVALILNHGTTQGTILLRIGVWQTAIRVIEAHPLTGLGLGHDTYWILADAYRVTLQSAQEPSPHDSYLELAALAGIPVLLVFLALLGALFRLAYKNYRRLERPYRPLLATILAVTVLVTFNSLDGADSWTARPIAWMAWILLGAAASPVLTRFLTSSRQAGSAQVAARKEVASLTRP